MTIAKRINIEKVADIISKHYEPGCHRKCYKNVWRKYVFPTMGISLRTFMRYLDEIRKNENK